MKNSKVLKSILFLSGILLLGIGGVITFIPIEFNASNGVDLGANISVLSDIRAASMVLLIGGLLILLGIFIPKLTFTSSIIAVLLLLGYGFGRALSMGLDGMPADALFKATIVEFVLGFANLFLLFKYKEDEIK